MFLSLKKCELAIQIGTLSPVPVTLNNIMGIATNYWARHTKLSPDPFAVSWGIHKAIHQQWVGTFPWGIYLLMAIYSFCL